jgi:hypothetical protein
LNSEGYIFSCPEEFPICFRKKGIHERIYS